MLLHTQEAKNVSGCAASAKATLTLQKSQLAGQKTCKLASKNLRFRLGLCYIGNSGVNVNCSHAATLDYRRMFGEVRFIISNVH